MHYESLFFRLCACVFILLHGSSALSQTLETEPLEAQPLKTQPLSYDLVCKFEPEFLAAVTGSDSASELVPFPMVLDGMHMVVFPLAPLTKNTEGKYTSAAGIANVYLFRGDLDDGRLSRLRASSRIRYCERIPQAITPPEDYPPESQDLSSYQTFHSDNPGIHVQYAHTLGLTGADVVVADIEVDWAIQHEDLVDQNVTFALPRTTALYTEHGTSVLGVWAAGRNGYGYTGMIPDAQFRLYPETFGGRAMAISSAMDDLSPGDVMVLQIQTLLDEAIEGSTTPYVPGDYNMALWDLVASATAKGIHVVAAAGNGRVDLDGEYFLEYRQRGDNGSILVGAGTADTEHRRRVSSTYGSPVHLQGWGEKVATLDFNSIDSPAQNWSKRVYGEDPLQSYTRAFSGTSAAAAMVAGVVAQVEAFAERELGRPIDPVVLRDLLMETGLPQGGDENIGAFPNLPAALQVLAEQIPGDVTGQVEIINGACRMTIESEFAHSVFGRIEIENTTDQPITDWQVGWTFKGGGKILLIWKGGLQGNNPYILRMQSQLDVIEPGDMLTIPFWASKGKGVGSAVALYGDVCRS